MLYLVSLRSQRPIFLSLSCTEFVLNFRSTLCSVVSHLFFSCFIPFRAAVPFPKPTHVPQSKKGLSCVVDFFQTDPLWYRRREFVKGS
jgi:hypothetical protein